MAKSPKRRKREARNSVIKLVVGVCIVIIFIGLIIANAITLAQSKAELESKKVALQNIEQSNDSLQDDIKNGNNLSYIQRWAKENGYAYPNDHVHEDGTPNGNN